MKYCLGAYVDIHGVPKGKFVPIEHFEHFAHGSELYTGYALDGLGQAPNDDEISSVPDLDHIIQLPWRKEVAWMPADNHFHGQPYPLNSRVLLKNVLGEAREMGFTFNLGIECEIYVLKQDEQGRLVVPNPDDNLEKSCYDVKRFMDVFPWLDEMAATMNGLGWDVYSLRSRGRQLAVRVRFQIRRRADDGGPLHLLPAHGEGDCREARPAGHLHAQAVRGQDRQRRAFQHVAGGCQNRQESVRHQT